MEQSKTKTSCDITATQVFSRDVRRRRLARGLPCAVDLMLEAVGGELARIAHLRHRPPGVPGEAEELVSIAVPEGIGIGRDCLRATHEHDQDGRDQEGQDR